jgi:hypothetical protein
VTQLYTHTQAKAAYESGERLFIVSPTKYPLWPQKTETGCLSCRVGAHTVLFEHRESGYLDLRCFDCGSKLSGGLYEVGIREEQAQRKRLFNSDLRMRVLRRDGARCWWCGATPEKDAIEIDHIIPAAAGGPTDVLNAVPLCKSCNSAKSATYDEVFVTSALLHTHRRELKCRFTWDVLRRVGESMRRWNLTAYGEEGNNERAA